MSDPYLAIARAAQSTSLTDRVTACAAQEGAPGDPAAWTYNGRWEWASAPGWGAAWASAEAGGNPDPGASEDVITDAQILAQVQAMLAA